MIAILPSDPRYEQINALQTMYAATVNWHMHADTWHMVSAWKRDIVTDYLESELWEVTSDPMIRRWIGAE